MTSIAILTIFVIFIIFVSRSGRSYKQKKKSVRFMLPPKSMHKCHHKHTCNCAHCRKQHIPDMVIDFVGNENSGLNELEQDTQTKGFVPYANQPNHVDNMWKSDQSQGTEAYSGANEISLYESDIQTPMRAKMVNMDIDDTSNMHIMSRFGCTGS